MSDKTWAHHPGGVVAEITQPLPADWVPGETIFADWASADVTDITALDQKPAVGWTVSVEVTGAKAFAPPVVVPPTPAQLVAYANARQWALATGGFVATIGGEPVAFATTESALGLMDGKVMRLAQPNPPASVNWQVGPTAFVTVAADDFVHAATLVSDFVQATFDALPAIFAAIAAGTIATTVEIDAAAWPANTGTVGAAVTTSTSGSTSTTAAASTASPAS